MNIPSYKHKGVIAVYDIHASKWRFKLRGKKHQVDTVQEFINKLDKLDEHQIKQVSVKFERYEAYLDTDPDSSYCRDRLAKFKQFEKVTVTSEDNGIAYVKTSNGEKKKVERSDLIAFNDENTHMITVALPEARKKLKEVNERVNKVEERLAMWKATAKEDVHKLIRELIPARSNIQIIEDVEKQLGQNNK